MVTAALTFVFTACLFWGKAPPHAVVLICGALALGLARLAGHSHSQFLSVDMMAQSSRLKGASPSLKLWALLALMAASAAAKSPAAGLFLFALSFALAVLAGGISPRGYARVLALPVTFLLMGGLALVVEASPAPSGVLNLRVFGLWLTVSAASQARAALITARALGAASCLCFLSVTTPMPEIIGALRRARCPGLVIDLMYLIYRYIFILLSLHHDMLNAAKSRLGFRGLGASVRSAGMIYGNLLARSYRCAGRNFDAMESRCYGQGIRFLERGGRVKAAHAAVCAAALAVSLWLGLAGQ